MMTEQTLGQRIAAERKKQGLSQEALGEKMGVSRQAISKWESDGAVPEIDKLIAMSRLFGVSVGWLLGVESEQPAQSPALSDEQMEMIEQIVCRYQTPPPAKKWPWILAVCLSAAALLMSLLAPSRRSVQAPDYTQQINSLQSQYQYLQENIQALTHKLEVMDEEDAEALLLDYTLDFTGIQDDGTARLVFSSTPKQWSPGQSAALSVLQNGAVVTEVPCTLDSAACTATVDLPLADGYEYRFVLTEPDGSMKFHLLDGYWCSDLESNTSIQPMSLTIPNATYRRGTLEFDKFNIGFYMPALAIDSGTTAWADLAYYLEVNGQVMERRSLFDDGILAEENRYDPDWSTNFASLFFDDVDLKNGDRVSLTFEASLSTGESTTLTIGTWTFTNSKLVRSN